MVYGRIQPGYLNYLVTSRVILCMIRSMIKDTSGQDEIIAAATPGWRRWVTVGISVAVVLTAAFAYPAIQRWASADQTVSRERLRIAQVTRGDLTRDVSAQGTVVAAIKPTLFSPATGTVSLKVQSGESVSQDQLLAEIDSPEILSLYEQAKSLLQSAKNQFERQQIQSKKIQLQNQQTVDLAEVALIAARRELRRAEAAHAKEAISVFDYDKANDDVATAELRFQHAREDAKLQMESLAFELKTAELEIEQQTLELAELERQVNQLQIRSPVTGMVGNLEVDDRDAVSRNQPLLSVVDLTAFEVELQVPDSFASSLTSGMPVEISHQGRIYSGSLRAISPEVIASQITARVSFSDQLPQNLRQNQRVSGRILLASRPDVLMVERGPFLESSGGRYTYVVEDNIARKTRISTGISSVASVEIVSGLQAGEEVVISSLREFNEADVVYLTN